jgi:predicted metal-dependent hydrolase
VSLFKIIFRRRIVRRGLRKNRVQYLKYKEIARALVMEKLAEFNKIYELSFNHITIRDTKSRWGSCSKKGNLNFNYRIVFLPPPLADYLVVHELCHLQEFNHSQKFWNLVAVAVPDYKKLRKELKNVRNF